MDEIFSKFQQETDRSGRPLNQWLERQDTCSSETLNNILDSFSTLECITNELRTFIYGPQDNHTSTRLNKTYNNFNLMTLKDDLSTRVEVLKTSAEQAKQDKEAKKAIKVSLQNKILEMKRDMDETLEETRQMEQLLNEGKKAKDLPLILRLMSSKDHQ